MNDVVLIKWVKREIQAIINKVLVNSMAWSW